MLINATGTCTSVTAMPISLQASLPGFDDDETEEGYNDESTNE